MKINLKQIINSTRGKYVFSILLGLGLATLFRKSCDSQNCLVFKAPSLKEIKNKIFGYDNKCFTYSEHNSSCKDSKDSNNIVLDVSDINDDEKK
jgi:hypothetical protein